MHYFVDKSHYLFVLLKIWLGTLGGPPGGREPRVPISRGKQKLLIGTHFPRPPWCAASVPSPILFLNNDSFRQNSALHILLLIGPVF